jgi:WD40 repeat protein
MIVPVVLTIQDIAVVALQGKRRRNINLWVLLLLLMVLVIGGCSSPKSLIATPTSMPFATLTLPPPSATTTITPSPTPTHTPSPTSTPSSTPIPVLPVLNGTPYPQPQEVISSENVDRIQQLSLLSTGWGPQDVTLSGDRRLLAIASASGVHLYNAETLQELPFLETNLTNGRVISAALSFDGKLLATGDYSGTIEIWDMESRQLLQTILDAHTGYVNSLAFSPDSRLLVSGGDDSRVIVWNVATGAKIHTSWHAGFIYQVTFSPDGNQILSASHDATIKLWDVQTGQNVQTFFDTAPVTAMAISPDGRMLASGSNANTITVWEIASRIKIYSFKGNFSGVASLSFSSDGRLLASGSADVVKLWDLTSGQDIRPSESRACVNSYSFLWGYRHTSSLLIFLPGDNLLLSGCPDDGIVKIWNVNSEGMSQEWPIGQNNVGPIAFSPDGRRVAAGLFEDVMAKIYDVASGQLLHTLSENYHGTNCDGVFDLAFSPDGSRLVSSTGCNFRALRMWDVESGESVGIFDKDGAYSPAFSPDGRLLAWVDPWGYQIILWDVVNNQEMGTWKAAQDGQWIHNIAFSPDGLLLAVETKSNAGTNPNNGQIQLWDVMSGKLVQVLVKQIEVLGIAFSTDGRFLAAGIAGQGVKIWEVESGNLVQGLYDHNQGLGLVAFLQSGDLLVRFQCTLEFWQVESGQLLHTYSMPPQLCSSQWAFSPDGRLLLSSGSNLSLWGVLP